MMVRRSRNILAYTFVMVLFLTSCLTSESPIIFDTPQPEGVVNEKYFPEILIGTYLDPQDSTLLSITNGYLITSSDSNYSGLLSDSDGLDKTIYKKDTSFSWVGVKRKSDFTIKGDSLFEHWIYIDTIFRFKKNIIRKFKGYYFLNTQVGARPQWYVRKVGLTKNGLILGWISEADLTELVEVAFLPLDTTNTFTTIQEPENVPRRVNGHKADQFYFKIDNDR